MRSYYHIRMNSTRIYNALKDYVPEIHADDGSGRAAVALVVRETQQDTELLLIERARHENDPWSGHIALPGGRMEKSDASPRHTAERETTEEIGLDMSHTKLLGQLNDRNGRSAGKPVGLIISCFVYHLQQSVNLQLNYEVQSALWVPASRLLDPDHTFEYQRPDIPERTFSGIRLGDNEQHILWGLTHRFLANFFDILQTPLPQAASGARQIRSE